MSSVYTPTSTVLHTTVTLPSDGDAASAASVNTAALKYLADNAAYLNALLVPAIAQGTGTALKVPGGSASQLDRQVSTFPNNFDSNWVNVNSTALNWSGVQTTGVTSEAIFFPVTFPATSFGTIKGFSASVQGLSGHGGLPATMPKLQLVIGGAFGGGAAGTLLATATDASGTVAAFEAVHEISATGLSIAIGNNPYFLKLSGEQGANSSLGFSCYSLKVSVSQ